MAFANTVQNSSHAVILLIILRMVMGSVKFRSTLPTILKIVVASLAMIAVAWGLQMLLSHIALFSLSHFIGALLTVIVAGGLAAGVYFALVLVLKVEEVRLLKGVVMSKLGKR